VRGRFAARKGNLTLPSNGRLNPALRNRLQEDHERSERIRGLIKGAKGIASRWGMPVPHGVKAQLRRIF
jgi:hypothetical protein